MRRRTPWQGRTTPNSRPTARVGKRIPAPIIDRAGFYGFRTEGLERLLGAQAIVRANAVLSASPLKDPQALREGAVLPPPCPALQKRGH